MSILSGIPPKRQYTQVLTDEWEAVQAEVIALKAENVRLLGGGWLSIESAPIDGTVILVCDANLDMELPRNTGEAAFVKGGWRVPENYEDGEFCYLANDPTHPQARPLPPKPEGESDV